jgi:hypothetical protein
MVVITDPEADIEQSYRIKKKANPFADYFRLVPDTWPCDFDES